jgi:phosphonate transport system substrate-binding protein
MREIRHAVGRFARIGAAAALGLAVSVSAMTIPAAAQDDDGSPFRFLKPWIEEQLFGSEATEPETPASPATPAVPDTAAAPVPTIFDVEPPPPGVAVAPPPVAPGEASPLPQTGAVPPALTPAEEAAALLRGADPSSVAPAPVPPAEGSVTLSAPVAPSEAAPETPARPEPLRFAVLAGRSLAGTMAAVGPVADALSNLIGRPVEILPLASYDAMIDAQTQRRIDGGFFSAAAYAVADARCACLDPLVAPRASDGTLAYHAVIVVRTGGGIASTSDLTGKTVAVGVGDSIGSRRVQLAGLLSEGLDPATFGAVLEVESATAAINLVASGVADAAFAWSSLAGNPAGGYSRGTLADLVAGGSLSMDRLSIVWRSPPIGHAPFAVARTLSEEEKGKIERYLVELSIVNPTAYDALDLFYGGGFAPVDAQDYSGLETLMAQDVDAIRLPTVPVSTGTTSPSSASDAIPPIVPQ